MLLHLTPGMNTEKKQGYSKSASSFPSLYLSVSEVPVGRVVYAGTSHVPVPVGGTVFLCSPVACRQVIGL